MTKMEFLGKEVIYCFFICFILMSEVLSDASENKGKDRSKRTIGLFLQSLASFLNVQDVENTTPVTFTTSAPGYRRKSPPKVQKWPPLDLEITPWVLQAVPPTVATPSPSYPATTTVHPTTEKPDLHAQLIIIPLSETENHFNFRSQVKNGHESNVRFESLSPKPGKYINSPDYQVASANYQSMPLGTQTQIYYWQRLYPRQRSGKIINAQASHLNQGLPELSQQHHLGETSLKNNQYNNSVSIPEVKSLNQIRLLPKDANTLLQIGYLYGRTLKDELSNLGGNDFSREKQEDKFRSFIDLEPKFKYIPNSTPKSNDLSRLYLLERSIRLKNVSNGIKFPVNMKKNHFGEAYSDDLDETKVEIVKSLEPVYFNINSERSLNNKEEKESNNNHFQTIENSSSSPSFEMVKSFEIPNSELSNGNKNFEFHLDPDEKSSNSKFFDLVNLNITEIRNEKSPFRNKKITLVPPSEREPYDQKKRVNKGKAVRLNKYFTPERLYQDVYAENEYLTKDPKYEVSYEGIKHQNLDDSIIKTLVEKLDYDASVVNINGNKFHQDEHNGKEMKNYNINYSSEDPNPEYENLKDESDSDSPYDYPVEESHMFSKINHNSLRSRYPNRGKVKYQQNGGFTSNQHYNDLISKEERVKVLPSSQLKNNDDISEKYSGDINPYSHKTESSKFNRGYDIYFGNLRPEEYYIQEPYPSKTVLETGKKPNDDNINSFDFPSQNQEAQLHIFFPDEQSLKSPEKQEKSDINQFQNDSPDYYHHLYELPNDNALNTDANGDKAVAEAEGIPRLPDQVHEQLIENNVVGRNVLSLPSFDQQTDMTEHKLKCLPQPFVKLKYACNNTEKYNKRNKI